KTMFQAGFNQDFFRTRQIGNGGRGGRAFTYEWDRDEVYRYCDPALEICPLPLVSPVMSGERGLSCDSECDCGSESDNEMGCKKCQDRRKRRRNPQGTIPDTSI